MSERENGAMCDCRMVRPTEIDGERLGETENV